VRIEVPGSRVPAAALAVASDTSSRIAPPATSHCSWDVGYRRHSHSRHRTQRGGYWRPVAWRNVYGWRRGDHDSGACQRGADGNGARGRRGPRAPASSEATSL